MEYNKLWSGRYKRIQDNRQRMWQFLQGSVIKDEWITKRPQPNLWSVDEIIRHMLASEIRYIHQSFNPSLPQSEIAVRAQWVGEIFFRIEEKEHVSLNKIIEDYESVEEGTLRLLNTTSENYGKMTKAPWGEEMPVYKLLESFYDHDNYHRGQIYLIINLFRKIPDFVRKKIE